MKVHTIVIKFETQKKFLFKKKGGRSVSCSDLAREVSSCRSWALRQRPTTGQQANRKRLWNTQLTGMSSSKPPLKPEASVWKRRQEDCKSWKQRETSVKDCSPYGRADAQINSQRLPAFTKHTQAQARQNPSITEGKEIDIKSRP